MTEGVAAHKLSYVNSNAKQNTLIDCSVELDKEKNVYNCYE